jgi:hypothetical protein
MRNQWKTKDQLRKGRHQKQGDITQEERNLQTKSAQADLELLEKQFARRAKKLEKKKTKRTKQ